MDPATAYEVRDQPTGAERAGNKVSERTECREHSERANRCARRLFRLRVIYSASMTLYSVF